MTDLKAAAFDLDDTLLHDDLSISLYTKEVFRTLASNGFLFIAASGRTLLSMKPFTDFLSCVSICISCNGALIWDPRSDKVLYRVEIPVELCGEIARFGKEYRCYAQTYSDNRFFFNEHSEYAERYASTAMLPGYCVGDLEVFIREPRSKILMMADEKKISDMLDDAQERFRGRVSVTCSKPYFLEFSPLEATKGIALKKAAGLMGVSVGEIITFGDSLNDLPMLEVSGRSVAVANARQEVLEFCHEICSSNQEDGVAKYLAANLLKGELPI